MKKSKEDLKIVNIPIYNYGLILVNRTKHKYSTQEVSKELTKRKYADCGISEIEFTEQSLASAYTLNNPLRGCVIINKKLNPETIAHECVHLTSYLFRGIGEKHDIETNDENYAYILQYFYTILSDFSEENKIINII